MFMGTAERESMCKVRKHFEGDHIPTVVTMKSTIIWNMTWFYEEVPMSEKHATTVFRIAEKGRKMYANFSLNTDTYLLYHVMLLPKR
jgi:hypothetical protein